MAEYETRITFGVIAYNESKCLPELLEDLVKQSYNAKLIEVILVDGESSDDTWQIMQEFKRNHLADYLDVKVLKNEKRIQPAGWNVVINNMTADVLLRIDAHARLPEDFVERNVERIQSGEDVCGGPRENIIDKATPWKRMLLSAEKSMFGSGFAKYRRLTESVTYVDSVFHGAYTKPVLNKVGMFNEKLVRTEDNEYHYRVREAGYRICFDPTIKSFYQTRSSLRGMIRQKYLNGFWVGKTMRICPKCISLFHFAPMCFVLTLLLVLVLGPIATWAPAIGLGMLYGVFLLVSTIASLIETHNIADLLLPFVIFVIHIAYGSGTIRGILCSGKEDKESKGQTGCSND